MKFPFLKNEVFDLREQVTFVGNECSIYLPKDFFDGTGQFAQIVGDKVSTIGVFWFQADKDWHQLQLPIPISFQFREKETRTLKLQPDIPEDTYIVFKLGKGDAFIWDINNKDDVSQVQFLFNKLLEGGKMPSYIPYRDIYKVFSNGIDITKIGTLGVSSLTFEMFLSELYRNKNDVSQSFRKAFNGKNEYAYKINRITSLTRAASVFTSLIGEDIHTGLTNAILRTREKKRDQESPVEKIIKY